MPLFKRKQELYIRLEAEMEKELVRKFSNFKSFLDKALIRRALELSLQWVTQRLETIYRT